MKRVSVWVGFDPREAACFAVARSSIRRQTNTPIPIKGVVLDELRRRGLYTRPTEQRGAQLWDVISDAPMSTEFACSRFLVPHLAKSGLALFMDCDIMARTNIMDLFALADPSKAVQCVQHEHAPIETMKMDGQIQTTYGRKNWSSVMLFNLDHPANKRLTVDMVNELPGRDLHRFCWLDDHEIGSLPARWNYLVGHTRLEAGDEPALVHWTEGAPCLNGMAGVEYEREFWEELEWWAT
jgi:lipopolysaccharide biosynthesis glycosyltransferase